MLILEVVTDALRNIGVLGVTDTPDAEQGADGVRKLNELMASLAEDGIDLGYAPSSSTADTIVLPLGQVSTIKALLSLRMAPIYGAEIPVAVAESASSGYNRLLSQALNLAMEPMKLRMAKGAGQYCGFNILTG
jgi:hypothetical protein